MVKTTGKFELVSYSPEFEDFLKAARYPEGVIKYVLASKPTVTFSQPGVDEFTFSVDFGDKEKSATFKLGEVWDEVKPDGTVTKSVTRRDGDRFITKTTFPDGRLHNRVGEFTADGFNVVSQMLLAICMSFGLELSSMEALLTAKRGTSGGKCAAHGLDNIMMRKIPPFMASKIMDTPCPLLWQTLSDEKSGEKATMAFRRV